MVATMVIVALCGLGVGMLSGLLGVGGGMIVIPLMRLAFGVDGLIASGTSLFVILPTSLTGVIGRLRGDGVIVWLGLSIGLGGVALSPIGSWISHQVGGLWPMVAAAIIIIYTGVNMARKALKKPASGTAAANSPASGTTAANSPAAANSPTAATAAAAPPAAGADIPVAADSAPGPTAARTPLERTRKHIAQAVLVGIVAGFLSGFIGVGGGFIIIPMCVSLFGLSFKDASGASLLALCILAVPGIITHACLGHVDFMRGILIAAGSIPGAFLGSMLLKRISDRTLRIIFGFMLLAVGATLAINEFVL